MMQTTWAILSCRLQRSTLEENTARARDMDMAHARNTNVSQVRAAARRAAARRATVRGEGSASRRALASDTAAAAKGSNREGARKPGKVECCSAGSNAHRATERSAGADDDDGERRRVSANLGGE
jgi:activator of HSP90 ATPase